MITDASGTASSSFTARLEIVRINDADSLYSDGMAESFEIDLRRDVSLYVISGRGILLMPGHARDRVVEDYHRRGRIVVRYINKPRDSGVHERGVADHADALTRARAAVGFVESVKS